MRDRYWLIGGAILFITFMILASGGSETETSKLDAPQASAQKTEPEKPVRPTVDLEKRARERLEREVALCAHNCAMAEYGDSYNYEEWEQMGFYCWDVAEFGGVEAVINETDACVDVWSSK